MEPLVTVGTDFNKVILLPALEVETRILKLVFPEKEMRPKKMTWTCFSKKGYSWTYFEEVRNMVYRPEYRGELRPADGALDVLHWLISVGHSVVIVTSREGESLRLAQEWLLEVGGPAIPFVGVGADSEHKKRCKAAVLSQYGVHVYVDNSSKKLLQITRERRAFARFPHLFHFISHGEIESGKNSPCPFAEPLFSWRHLPFLLRSLCVAA